MLDAFFRRWMNPGRPIEIRRQTGIIMLATAVSMVLCLFSIPLAGQSMDSEMRVHRFQLYTACSQITSFVTVKDDERKLPDLTEASLSSAVTSRLRSARLYQDRYDQNIPSLQVTVQVVGHGFSIDLKLYKWVFDQFSDLNYYAATYELHIVGTHGIGGAQFIRGGLAEYMDKFIDDYMRVNESACGN